MLVSDAILPYFSQYSNPSSALYQKAFVPTFPNDFAHDVRSGTLPSVSWIIPPLGYDEHPPSPTEPRGVVHRPGPPDADRR